MLGIGRGVTMALVGWLWADLLLGLFAIFLAANSAGAPVQASTKGIDPQVVQITVATNGAALLSADSTVAVLEQQRVAGEIRRKLSEAAPGKQVALVLAFGTHDQPAEGDRLAKLATEPLRADAFTGAILNSYHAIKQGDPGSSVALEIYVYL